MALSSAMRIRGVTINGDEDAHRTAYCGQNNCRAPDKLLHASILRNKGNPVFPLELSAVRVRNLQQLPSASNWHLKNGKAKRTEATLGKVSRVVGKSIESQTLRPGERTNFEGKPIANGILLEFQMKNSP
jgi:hypothetical protein